MLSSGQKPQSVDSHAVGLGLAFRDGFEQRPPQQVSADMCQVFSSGRPPAATSAPTCRASIYGVVRLEKAANLTWA